MQYYEYSSLIILFWRVKFVMSVENQGHVLDLWLLAHNPLTIHSKDLDMSHQGVQLLDWLQNYERHMGNIP